jgi:chromosome segregation protein
VRREEELKSLAERLQRENAVGSQAVGAVQGAVVALKVQVAKLRERMEHFHRALERLYTMARELDAEEETRQLDLARNREELARQKERAGQIAKDREMIGGEIDAHRRAIEILADERHGGSRQLMAWEDERTVLRSDLENIEVERGVAQVEAAEKKMEMERLKGEMWDRYGVDIALAEKPGAFDVTEEDGARLERLKEDLRRIGDVNLDSISELEELRTRQAFLSSQKDDLEKSLDDLARTVSHLNREFRTRFLATFENVSQRLGEVFPKLFSGGHARLVLTDEEDVLDSGIDIVAQPPGKKLQSIGLLSGGEKALTALALIFSVFLIKPAPFCLLDEVDAALDDANIDRFNDLVREMSGLSQLILVTHNKKTMELADCLYGITMQQPGKSRIVSVSLE